MKEPSAGASVGGLLGRYRRDGAVAAMIERLVHHAEIAALNVKGPIP